MAPTPPSTVGNKKIATSFLQQIRQSAQAMRARFYEQKPHAVRDTFTLEATVVRRSLLKRDLQQSHVFGQKLVQMIHTERIPFNFHKAILKKVPQGEDALACLDPHAGEEEDGSVTAPPTEVHAYTDLDARSSISPKAAQRAMEDPNPEDGSPLPGSTPSGYQPMTLVEREVADITWGQGQEYWDSCQNREREGGGGARTLVIASHGQSSNPTGMTPPVSHYPRVTTRMAPDRIVSMYERGKALQIARRAPVEVHTYFENWKKAKKEEQEQLEAELCDVNKVPLKVYRHERLRQ